MVVDSLRLDKCRGLVTFPVSVLQLTVPPSSVLPDTIFPIERLLVYIRSWDRADRLHQFVCRACAWPTLVRCLTDNSGVLRKPKIRAELTSLICPASETPLDIVSGPTLPPTVSLLTGSAIMVSIWCGHNVQRSYSRFMSDIGLGRAGVHCQLECSSHVG